MGNTKKSRKRVLVISRNYNNLLCMTRSLAGGDYDIELVRLIQVDHGILKMMAKLNPERTSKYVSAYHVCMTGWKEEKFIEFLLGLHDPERDTLLIPCDDLALPWIDNNYDLLKDYYKISHIDGTQGMLADFMNKQKQKRQVLSYGLPAAGSHEIHIRDGKYEMPEGIGFPCFLKPAVLVMGCKDYLKRYDNMEDLKEAVDAMAVKLSDMDVLIEDFIEITDEYAVLGLSADGRVLLPDGCLKFVKGGHGSRKGIMATGEIVSTPEILDFLEKLEGFVKTIGYTGLFDVDVLASGDKLYFCELNLRFGGSGYAITKGGVNFPRMYAEYMLWGDSLPKTCKLTGIGKTFVSEKILFEDKIEHFITAEEAEKEIQEADIHFIMDPEDPAPYRRMKSYFRYTAKAMMTAKEAYKKLRR